MRGRVFGAGRKILPIRQKMNGDEIDIGADFPVTRNSQTSAGAGTARAV
jgi:hypothetical protein